MHSIEMFDAATVKNLRIKKNTDTDYALTYLRPLMHGPIHRYVANVWGEMRIVVIDRRWVLPVFIPEPRPESAYTASLYSHYIRYGKQELRELHNPPLEWCARGILALLGLVLRIGDIDRGIYINNWLLSTNLYTDLPASSIDAVSRHVADVFPGRPIVWCSINRDTTPEYTAEMQRLGYRFLFSRSVYIQRRYNDLGAKTNSRLRRESKLLAKSGYQFEDTCDAARTQALYNLLYVDQYSTYNPLLTAEFMRHAAAHQLLTYRSLCAPSGDINGVVGYFYRQGVMTTPVLGYDTRLARADAPLYRILSYELLSIARLEGYVLHQSSGVGQFKRDRGAIYSPEYRTVYDGSAPLRTRFAFRVLQVVLDGIVAPVMERRGL